jgi:hypothetical protein
MSPRTRARAIAGLSAAAGVVAGLVAGGSCSPREVTGGGVDAAPDGADAADASADAAPDALPRDLANGEPCAISAQCRGACCELHRGNSTSCANIAPFDTTQNCACADDAECAAIQLCGKPDFCQEPNDVSPQRFCSRVCR